MKQLKWYPALASFFFKMLVFNAEFDREDFEKLRCYRLSMHMQIEERTSTFLWTRQKAEYTSLVGFIERALCARFMSFATIK